MNNEQNFEPQTPETPEPPKAPETPPKASKAPQQPYVYPPIRPIRRVGTLTMGFALICTGLIALAATFYKGFDLVSVLKLSPVIFVFLGIEVLIGYFRFKGERIKYDFLSGFVCFLLICGGIGLSFVPMAWEYFGPGAYQVRENMRDYVEDDLYNRLHRDGLVSSLYVRVPDFIYSSQSVTPDMEVDSLLKNTNIYLSVRLGGAYTDTEQFGQACRTVLDRIGTTDYRIRNIDFAAEGPNRGFDVGLSGKFQQDLDAAQIANETNVNSYDEDDNYEGDEVIVRDDEGNEIILRENNDGSEDVSASSESVTEVEISQYASSSTADAQATPAA